MDFRIVVKVLRTCTTKRKIYREAGKAFKLKSEAGKQKKSETKQNLAGMC